LNVKRASGFVLVISSPAFLNASVRDDPAKTVMDPARGALGVVGLGEEVGLVAQALRMTVAASG